MPGSAIIAGKTDGPNWLNFFKETSGKKSLKYFFQNLIFL